MRQILFYGAVHSFSVRNFVDQLNKAIDDAVDSVVIRVSSPGGDIDPGWGLITSIKEFIANFDGDVKIKVDGRAASWGAFFLLFFDDVEALAQSRFMLHRAAYPSWVEMTDERVKELRRTNKELRKIIEAKIDIKRFEKIANTTMDRIFDENQPVLDVEFTGKQAKSIGLIKKVVNLSPVEAKALNAQLIAAHADPIILEEIEDENFDTEPQKDKKMTEAEFKEKHPALYAQLRNAAVEEGVLQERTRINAWMKWNEFDAEAVAQGIEGGKDISMNDISGFTAEAAKKGIIANAQNANAGDTSQEDGAGDEGGEGEGVTASEDNPELKAFTSDVKKNLKLETEQK